MSITHPSRRIQHVFQGFAVATGNKIIERGRRRGNEIENELLHALNYTFAPSFLCAPSETAGVATGRFVIMLQP